MFAAWRRAALVGVGVSLAACGGGAGAGAGCGGAPLPDGFPSESRITNAGTVRLTRPGLDFLAENGATLAGSALGSSNPSGTAKIAIPQSTQTGQAAIPIPIVGGTLPVDYTINICPDGPKPTATPPECNVEIDLKTAKLEVDALTPNALRLRGDFPVRLQNLPLQVTTSIGLNVTAGVGFGTLIGTGCDATVLTKPTVAYKTFPAEIVLPMVAETRGPRIGYTKIDVDNAQVKLTVEDKDIAICASCGGFLDTIGACGFMVDQAKAQAFKSFGGDALATLVKQQLKTAVCEKPNPAVTPTCPTDTVDKGGVCVLVDDNAKCVTTLLGTSGHLDSSNLAGGLSSGEGGLDYLFAAGGPMNPAPASAADDTPYEGHTPNGMTLTMFGGSKPSPASKCVPAFTHDLPTNLPVPDELLVNGVQPWPAGTPGPHVGLAFAGRFLDYAFADLYGGGALCLGATTEQVDQLKTGLLSILIPSIKNLTFEQKGAAMAITTRPQAPPRLELGTGADLQSDPLLRIQLDRFAIDFYVFTLDRFVRVFTFTADLTIPINLQTGKDPVKNPNGGLLPVLGSMVVAKPVVTDSQLLLEDPTKIASALASVVGGLTSQLTGSIAPIDLGTALAGSGVGLSIPEGGIRRITKGDERFLAIFANFVTAQAATLEADARARIVERIVDKEAMTLSTLRRETRPILRVAFESSLDDSGKPVEWSWAIDHGARSAWSHDRASTIQTDDLVLQGRHVLRVWARVQGDARTEDTTPAEVPFVIDALAPTVRAVETSAGTVRIDAFDYVSDPSALRVRVRTADTFGHWSTLASAAAIETGTATSLEVEVADEEDNVGRTKIMLIRGRKDPTLAGGTAAGCGCVAAGSTGRAGAAATRTWALAALALALTTALRRRSSHRGTHRATAAIGAAGLLALSATLPACSCGSEEAPAAQCGSDCRQPCGPTLPLGMIGAYTSVAKAKDGTLHLAGYADATLSPDGTTLYGDLVVGRWDRTKPEVVWQAVDGVPARTDGTCPTNDRSGFRGGEAEQGDDVGLWTSIALGEGETPLVAYHDATHRSLKFAYKVEGSWKSYAIFEKKGVDAGRYAKLLVIENRPTLVFLVIEPGGKGGHLKSRIVLAKASDARPADASKWTFQDMHVSDETPCRPELCAAGETCVKGTKICQKTIAGCPSCAAGTACIDVAGKATCSAVLSEPFVQTVPEAIGTYLSAAVGPKGLGVVAYDRIHGNLLGLSPNGTSYAVNVLDGESGSRADGTAKDTGDVGLGAALTISANGDWHIAAVDGSREQLVHVVAHEGTKLVARSVVDDGFGLGLGTPPFADGKHIVGDDAVIRIEETGSVTICYQDATAAALRCAFGTHGSDGQTAFRIDTVSQPNRAGGFFPQFIPGSREVASHWRSLDRGTQTFEGNVSILKY